MIAMSWNDDEVNKEVMGYNEMRLWRTHVGIFWVLDIYSHVLTSMTC